MKDDYAMHDFQKLLNYSNKIITKAIVSKTSDKEIIIAGLFTRIINGAEAVKLLLSKEYSIDAEILVRSLLEPLFYLGACYNDDDAIRDYKGKFALNRIKEINIILNNKKRFKLGSDDIRNFRDKLDTMSSEIKKRKIKHLSAERASNICSLRSLYLAYRIHSDAIHCDPMYIKENLMKYDEHGVTQINIGPVNLREENVLLTINCILSYAIRWYSDLFNLDFKPEILNLCTKYIGECSNS